jgi:hypothetical protein
MNPRDLDTTIRSCEELKSHFRSLDLSSLETNVHRQLQDIFSLAFAHIQEGGRLFRKAASSCETMAQEIMVMKAHLRTSEARVSALQQKLKVLRLDDRVDLQQSIFVACSQQSRYCQSSMNSVISKCTQRLVNEYNARCLTKYFARWKAVSSLEKWAVSCGLIVLRSSTLRSRWKLVRYFFRKWGSWSDSRRACLRRVRKGWFKSSKTLCILMRNQSKSAFNRWKIVTKSAVQVLRLKAEKATIMRRVARKLLIACLLQAFNRYKARFVPRTCP